MGEEGERGGGEGLSQQLLALVVEVDLKVFGLQFGGLQAVLEGLDGLVLLCDRRFDPAMQLFHFRVLREQIRSKERAEEGINSGEGLGRTVA